jgi:hypothetical protein
MSPCAPVPLSSRTTTPTLTLVRGPNVAPLPRVLLGWEVSDMTTDVESLYASSIDAKPIPVDSWSDLLSEDADAATYWQTFDYEHEEHDTTYVLMSQNGWVSGLVTDGALDTDREDITEGAEPYMHGAEGPMMNYWYPVESIDDDADAVSAAIAIDGLPLCVVRVGNDYGLALTGGGMDLSWDICAAYVATGSLPPAHFADLPSFAGGHGERPEVAAAMIRSLRITAERAQRALTRLTERFPEVTP